jgi:hypothetical protein
MVFTLFVVLIVVYVLSMHIASVFVYGPLMKDCEIEKLLEEGMHAYTAPNAYSGRIVHGLVIKDGTLENYPFIAKQPVGILSAYYFDGHGQVPRWSKFSETIEELFRQ